MMPVGDIGASGAWPATTDASESILEKLDILLNEKFEK